MHNKVSIAFGAILGAGIPPGFLWLADAVPTQRGPELSDLVLSSILLSLAGGAIAALLNAE